MKVEKIIQTRSEFRANKKMEIKKARKRELKKGTCGVLLATTIMTSVSVTSAAELSEYTVNKQDTFYKLSQSYGVSVEYLQEINGKKDVKLRLGETILVPVKGLNIRERVVAKGDTWYKYANEAKVSVEELLKMNGRTSHLLKEGETVRIPTVSKTETEKKASDKETVQVVKTVEEGDSLWKIAREFRTTVDAISKTNQLKNHKIKVGQKLKIDGITQASSKIIGAVDSNFVEYKLLDGESIVLKVTPFYNTDMFANRSGLKAAIQYNEKTNELISFKVVE